MVLDRIDAQVGKLAFTGDYRYEPGVARPHRLRLRAESWDAADLEAELMPTLRRSTNLIARALGRPMVTDWLRQRNLDGTVQIDDLLVAGGHLENFRARVLWDVARVQVENIQARLDRAALTGRLDVNLRGSRPNYKLTSKITGMNWQSGKVDVESDLETFGTGMQLLTNATAEGTFSGAGIELGTLPALRSMAGVLQLFVVAIRTAVAFDRPESAHRGRDLHRPRRHPGRRPPGHPAHQWCQGNAYERDAREIESGVGWDRLSACQSERSSDSYSASYPQFSDGRATWSITSASTGPLVACNRRPSCCEIA